MSITSYSITRERLNSAKQYRKAYRHNVLHGFHHLSWIKTIKIDLYNELATIYWVFGIKTIYSMDRVTIYYLLRDCGFSDCELEVSNTVVSPTPTLTLC
jgi:hypothetical protein